MLQEREVRPVGGTRPRKADVRVIAASNRPLADLRAECLREDLYYRIATVVIEIPPLRACVSDLLVLAQHFTGRLGRRHGRHIALARSARSFCSRTRFRATCANWKTCLKA